MKLDFWKLPIPNKPWKSVSMDFISGFHRVRDMSSVMVVVDLFSEYVIFVPTPNQCSIDLRAQLFFTNITIHWGLSEDIISDQNPKFTDDFWMALFGLLGSELKFSTAHHPQRDDHAK